MYYAKHHQERVGEAVVVLVRQVEFGRDSPSSGVAGTHSAGVNDSIGKI
jgi:hypothetical protein